MYYFLKSWIGFSLSHNRAQNCFLCMSSVVPSASMKSFTLWGKCEFAFQANQSLPLQWERYTNTLPRLVWAQVCAVYPELIQLSYTTPEQPSGTKFIKLHITLFFFYLTLSWSLMQSARQRDHCIAHAVVQSMQWPRAGCFTAWEMCCAGTCHQQRARAWQGLSFTQWKF